jgi:hypothetical protein
MNFENSVDALRVATTSEVAIHRAKSQNVTLDTNIPIHSISLPSPSTHLGYFIPAPVPRRFAHQLDHMSQFLVLLPCPLPAVETLPAPGVGGQGADPPGPGSPSPEHHGDGLLRVGGFEAGDEVVMVQRRIGD